MDTATSTLVQTPLPGYGLLLYLGEVSSILVSLLYLGIASSSEQEMMGLKLVGTWKARGCICSGQVSNQISPDIRNRYPPVGRNRYPPVCRNRYPQLNGNRYPR
jgi:hypothetical protein